MLPPSGWTDCSSHSVQQVSASSLLIVSVALKMFTSSLCLCSASGSFSASAFFQVSSQFAVFLLPVGGNFDCRTAAGGGHQEQTPPEILIPHPQACSPLLIRFILSILVKVVEVLPPVVCPNVPIGRFVVGGGS